MIRVIVIVHAVALGVGYLYALGYIDKLKISDMIISQQEQDGILKSAITTKGWITNSSAMGTNAWMPVSQNDPDGSNNGSSSSSSSMPTIFPNSHSDKRTNPEEVFKGAGQKLGGAGNTMSKDEIKAARLAALEKNSHSAAV